MVQRNRRTSKKKQQLTYEDIKDLSPEQLEQMGLGSWLKDNAGNLVQTIGGGLMTAVGTGLIATGIGAPAGAALAGAGVGMISSGASGFSETAAQNESEALQEKQILNQNSANAANTEFQNKMNENPLESYGVTMRGGGKLPKYQTESALPSNPKAYVPPTESVSNSMRRLKGETTEDMEAYFAGDPNVALQHTSFPDQIYHLRQINDPYSEYNGGYEIGLNLRANEGRVNAPLEKVKAANWAHFMDTHREKFIGPYSKYLKDSKPQQMAMGGTINYGGQLHEGPDGGVPVDAQGNPNSQNPVALVEKGEVKYDTGEGDYIFSDQLELRKGKTFAKKAKDIQAKYKMRISEGVITDPIAKKGYDKEMQDLVKKQEELRSIVTPQEQPMMWAGGNIGEILNFVHQQNALQRGSKYINDYITSNSADLKPYDTDTDIDFGTFEEAPIVTLGRDNMLIPNKLTPRTASLPSPDIMPTRAQSRKDFDQVLSNAPKDNLYQGQTWAETGLQMIPDSASGISNILMARSRKRAAENMPSLRAPEVVPQQINLEAARAGVREQGNVARANTRRGLRGAASTAGQYMGNVGATETGIQRGVSEGLNQLNIQEETTNAGLRSSAEALNAQMKARTQEMNAIREQQLLDAYYNQLAGGIGQIGQGITGALSTKASSSQAANMIQMMQPNYELTVDGNPVWGIGNKIKRTPRRTE